MLCPKCQFENPEGVNFCVECGGKLEVICPECGYSNSLSYKFCGGCGIKLTLPTEAIPKELSFDEKLTRIQRYLPKGLTDKILSQKDRIEGERKHVTVMFCDMEGFTNLSEMIGPEEAYAIMDQVYEILIHKVHDYEGTVNEMTGDGIMALFGAPVALEDAPQRAIRSSLAIHREIAKFNDQLRQEKKRALPVKMRIGIHSGPVVIGTLGNDLRVEFKAVGDTVNLASRMEGQAQPGTTYITEDTFRITEGFFRFEALGQREIKGKEKRVNAYRVIAPSTRRTRFDVSAERGLTPFVGRERELELLLDGFERIKGGQGQAFSIIAEAGVGKSRLLYEFRKAVSNEDASFVEGKCLSYQRDAAYHPIIDSLKANFDIRDADGDTQITEKVKKGLQLLNVDESFTLPNFLELLSVKESGIDKTAINPEAKKAQIIDALKQIVVKGSELRPLILSYEDLHWIDKSSEDALKYLIESIPGARILMIFTYRTEFLPTWSAKSFHSQITLNRLSNRESLIMASHLLGADGLDKDLEELILKKTEGVPFFVEEFIRSLKDLKIIESDGNKYCLAKDTQAVIIPSTIHDVIMARVDMLPDAAKQVLQTGSVAGREFSHELIMKVTGLREQEMLSHLSVLKNSELIYERGIYPQSTYVFKHALTQELIYDNLLLKRKKELHVKIGIAIERIYPERLEEFYEMLAYHYSKTDNLKKAYQYLNLSGEKALRNYSNWEAFRFYKKAIKVLQELSEIEERKGEQIKIQLLISIAIGRMGYPEGSLEILLKGEKLAKALGDTKSLATFYSRLCHYHTIRGGDPQLGIKYGEKCFKEAEGVQDIELMAPIACDLCSAYFVSGKFIKTIDMASKVLALLEKEQRKNDFFGTRYIVFSGLSAYCGFAHGIVGNFDKGNSLFEDGLLYSREVNDLYGLGFLKFMQGSVFLWKGDGKRTIAHVEESIRYLEKGQGFLILGLSYSALGAGYFLLGDLETARKQIENGLKIQNDHGISFYLSLHYCFLSDVYFASGDIKNAQVCIEEALKFSQQNNEKHIEGISWLLLGRIQGKRDIADRTKAEKYMIKGTDILEELSLKPWANQGHLFLGHLYADTGQKEKALEHLNMAKDQFQKMGMDYWLNKTLKAFEKF